MTIALVVGFSQLAYALPLLQLYIEGSDYHSETESWVTASSDFILWVLGDVKEKKGSGFTIHEILDVQLAVAFPSNESGTIELIPTTATSGSLPSPGDASTPSSPIFLDSGVGNQPTMSDGRLLPAHGIYGPGISWESYLLGDFTLTDSPIGDYASAACPDGLCTYPDLGQINAYIVKINGYSRVHFDTFDSIEGANHSRFAPFSHDAEGVTPEPGTLSLLGLGLLGLAAKQLNGKDKRKL